LCFNIISSAPAAGHSTHQTALQALNAQSVPTQTQQTQQRPLSYVPKQTPVGHPPAASSNSSSIVQSAPQPSVVCVFFLFHLIL
jgi:hypothetical protein